MFHCRLEMPSPAYADSGSTPVWENVGHTYDCLVMEGCRQLEDTDCRFVIGGFGQQCWRFDVGYDMSSLVEQLPELLRWIWSCPTSPGWSRSPRGGRAWWCPADAVVVPR
ncbi:hypothetical protein [Streptomyces coffeae]|uniref:Uncharacterized protein n=1 Tax=Streptomyces coffeae TaxID=621382 RepID=A0ABS1NDB7_9ACTN|nr:hypothetical protein [Streptomyces coffeae]MBL1098091.1 hypothetical protein [Streptomyces coffeae]